MECRCLSGFGGAWRVVAHGQLASHTGAAGELNGTGVFGSGFLAEAPLGVDLQMVISIVVTLSKHR